MSNTPPTRRLLSIEEFRHRVGISRSKFYELKKEGRIRAIKIGRITKIPTEFEDEFLASLPAA